MKKFLEYAMFIAAFAMITINILFGTWTMWVSHDDTSSLSQVVAIVVAIIMALCLFVWPVILGLGRWRFSPLWSKAAKQALWSSKTISYYYYARNWGRFILHGLFAGVLIFSLHLLGDIIVFQALVNISQKARLLMTVPLFFWLSLGIVYAVRYVTYLRTRYKLPLSKHL